MVKVSVVIPSYNRADLLYRVLYSLWRQNDPCYEVLVSNDDDKDRYLETEEVCKEFGGRGMDIHYFYTGQYKRGQGWSVETYPYNVGIRNATGDIIILNSGDVMSVTNTIDQHRNVQSGGNDVCISTVHALTQNLQKDIDRFDWKNNPHTLLFKGSCQKMYTGIGLSFTSVYPVEEARVKYHWQLSVRRGILNQIRGFDEDFYGAMGCGDDDMADRLTRFPCSFVWKPEILAIHQFHASPEFITPLGAAQCNTGVESGHTLYRRDRSHMGIIRNAAHEWGQYPRDMEHLPKMSGVVQ